MVGHLLGRLHPGSGHVELNIHTVWALLLAHPSLLVEHPRLRSEAAHRIELTAADDELSVQAQRELSDIRYAVRLARP